MTDGLSVELDRNRASFVTPRLVAEHPMRGNDLNIDYLYIWFGSRALRRENVPTPEWGPLHESWLTLQSEREHRAGSFAPGDVWSSKGYGGRTYATAVMALALEEALRE